MGRPSSLIKDKCSAVYRTMFNESVEQEDGTRVWSGKTTVLVTQLGVPIGSYNSIMIQLKHLGCITKLTEGRANYPSRYLLNHEPESVPWTTPGERVATGSQTSGQPLTQPVDYAMLAQQIADIRKSLGGNNAFSIIKAIAHLEQRIEELHKEVAALKKERTVG